MRVIIIKAIIYTLGEATYLASRAAAEVIGMGEPSGVKPLGRRRIYAVLCDKP